MNYLLFTDPVFLRHVPPPGHPERVERLAAVKDLLKNSPVPGTKWSECGRIASDEDLKLVHTADHIARVEATAGAEMSALDPDTYASEESARAARTAVGANLDAVDAVVSHEADRAFALVRPPGHHAERDRAMGFCLYNNVALAAEYAIRRRGVSRVAVYDFDVHHGNGTQHIFYDRADVLYLSHHQFPLYPGTGGWTEVGIGDGRGFTLNCPLPAGSGDTEVTYLWENVFSPAVSQFRPDILLVSAGYDAHTADPLAQLRMTDEGYRSLLARVEDLADRLTVPIVYTLEGGYDTQALARCVRDTVGAYRRSAAQVQTDPPSQLAISLAKEAAKHFRPFWNL